MMLSDVCLSDICLSHISGLSREQRGLGRPKLAQRPTSHVTQKSLSRSKVKVCFTHRHVGASGSCSGERGNALAVGTYCYVAVCTLQAWSAQRCETLRRLQRRRGAGHIVAAAHLQLGLMLVYILLLCVFGVDSITDVNESCALSILGSLLVDGEKSPFYYSLLESGIGSDYAPTTG